MPIDCIWTVLLIRLFQFLSDAVRLAHQPLAFLLTLLCCHFHLVAATDGVLVIDDELLAMADAVLVASPDVTLQPYHVSIVRGQRSP